MLIASATAATLSWQLPRKWPRFSGLWNGLIQASILTVCAAAICRMLFLLGDAKQPWEWALRIGQCGVIGFVLGALAPARFQARHNEEAAAADVLPQPIQESLQRRLHTGRPWWEGD
jgi:hypothetical protein